MQLRLADSEATESLGRMLAVTRPAQAMVHLQGDLGAGKSTLARALLRELGVQGAIRSPTSPLARPGIWTCIASVTPVNSISLGWTTPAPPCGWSNGRKRPPKRCLWPTFACSLPTTRRAGRSTWRLDHPRGKPGWRPWPCPRGCANYLFNPCRKWWQVTDY